MRTFGVSPHVSVPDLPLYMLPDHLGQGAATAIQTGGAVGGKVAGSVVASVASSAGWGAAAGPIGAAVAVGIGLIAGLLAAHEQRKKQAQNENQAVNLGVAGFDQGLHQIQQAFAAGTDAATCAQAAQLLLTNYWAEVGPHIQPGRNGCNTGASCPGQNIPANYCSGNIGAACCVGCEALARSITGPNGVLAALQGMSTSANGATVADIQKVFPSKYGTSARGGYTVTFTPPTASASASGALTSIESAVGGGSGLLVLALAAGALFLLR